MAQPNSPDMPPKCTTKVQLQNFEVTSCKCLQNARSFDIFHESKQKQTPAIHAIHKTDNLNILKKVRIGCTYIWGWETSCQCVYTFPADTLLIYNKIWDEFNWVRICPINDKV